MKTAFIVIIVAAALGGSQRAAADCNCLAVAGDVSASVQAQVAKADGLYARGDFSGALAIYASAYATSKDASLLYAQGMANWQLGVNDKAKANFEAYLTAGGNLLYKDRAQAGLAGIGAGVKAGVGGVVGGVGGVGGGLAGGVGGTVTGTVDGGVGAVGGVSGSVQGKAKVGKKAGIILGVIAIAAIGAVGVHSIAAWRSPEIELDAKFDLGLGIAGVAVGISAIYVAGLTAATAAAPRCASLPAGRPIVAPYATRGGGGIAAAMSF